LSIDSRHDRYGATLAGNFLFGCFPAWSPGLAQESRQGDARLVLAVEQSPIFLDCGANLGQSFTQPLLSDFRVGFAILTGRFLVGQARFLQATQDGTHGHGGLVALRNHLMQSLGGPEIRFKVKRGCRLQDNIAQLLGR
jgi:hypothetical protein